MKKIKNLQIKRPLSLLLAAGILACARPVAVCNRAQALTKGNVELGKTFFASNTELGSTWGDVSVDITSGDVSTSGGTGQKLIFGSELTDKEQDAHKPKNTPSKRIDNNVNNYIPWYICSRLKAPTDALAAENIAASPANTNALVLYSADTVGSLPFCDSEPISNNWNTSAVKTYLTSSENPALQSRFFYKGELNLISDSVVKVLPYGSNMQTNIDAAKFFLPCGSLPLPNVITLSETYNIKESGFISWGEDDAVTAPMNDLSLVANKYEKTIIPMEYWPSNKTCWLRSASTENDEDVLVTEAEVGVTSSPANTGYSRDMSGGGYVAPACKIDLASVKFASAAVNISTLLDRMEELDLDQDDLIAIKSIDALFYILDPDLPETTPPEGENPGKPETPPEGENPGKPETPPEGENPGDMRKPKPKEKRLLTKSKTPTGPIIETVSETGMYLRFASDDVHAPTVTNDIITGTAGEVVMIQGFTNGVNWSYSKRISKDASGAKSQVTLDDVNSAGLEAEVFSKQNKLTSFEKVTVWGEKLGTGDQEGLLLTGTKPKENPGNGSGVNSPPTGDNLQTWLWLGGAGIGMISVGVAIFYRTYRKRRRV